MAASARSSASANREVPVADYEHSLAKRSNNPPSGLAHLDREPTPIKTLAYDPHLDPQLTWAGKAERSTVDVPAPSVHVHEELSAQKIIGSVRRQRLQQPLFDLDVLDPAAAVEFYQHDLDWSNRMVLGDSLIVMASLIERERMAGKVQCLFIDPPYGIRYQSNFQPNISDRNVRDGKDESLTREPEMIQAYRDTWELGTHSYLTYLRDRFQVAHELLTESGSLFVQIGEENVHRVRVLLDEVFGADNFVSQITFATTSGAGAPAELKNIPAVSNYLVWYARDVSQMKYRQLYLPKATGRSTAEVYTSIELIDGTRRRMTADERSGRTPLPEGSRVFSLDNLVSMGASETSSFEVEFEGRSYRPGRGHWKTGAAGMERLRAARRIQAATNSLRYVRYLDDFNARPLVNTWDDTGTGSFTDDKKYVVQTNTKVIERCLLMTTDAGDLVLDPTCGSGTTAFVAEKLGRRWITVDTSRVAIAIARERLLTARFDYYKLRDSQRGVDGGLEYRTLNRVTLRSIARGEEPEKVTLWDDPVVVPKTVRVSGPFTVEALSRYAVNPVDPPPSLPEQIEQDGTADHVAVLLRALRSQGVPRPGAKPLRLEQLERLESAGAIQASALADFDGRKGRVGISLGPKFGAVTMAQVSDALREAIGYDLVVFAGFAVAADAQDRLGTGKVGGTDVALLLANPDLLVGDLLKNTTSSQTFRLYASPDVDVVHDDGAVRVVVNGVDAFDAATGEVTSYGKAGVQAWFLDEDYDGMVFRVSQAFFPVSDGWKKIQQTLRGTVDHELIEHLHGWESLPFEVGEHGRVAVRVIAQDGNAAELVRDVAARA